MIRVAVWAGRKRQETACQAAGTCSLDYGIAQQTALKRYESSIHNVPLTYFYLIKRQKNTPLDSGEYCLVAGEIFVKHIDEKSIHAEAENLPFP